jgi:ribosome maturation factor RimP
MAINTIQLRDTLVSAVQALGYELWGYELGTGARRLLIRVFLEAPNGVTIDDCALASRQINALLEVNMPDLSDYVLEVSSPGLDRPLYTLAHYEQFIGETIQLKTIQPYEGRRNFTGILQAVTPTEQVIINVDNQEYSLAFANIEKAKLLPKISINRKS